MAVLGVVMAEFVGGKSQRLNVFLPVVDSGIATFSHDRNGMLQQSSAAMSFQRDSDLSQGQSPHHLGFLSVRNGAKE